MDHSGNGCAESLSPVQVGNFGARKKEAHILIDRLGQFEPINSVRLQTDKGAGTQLPCGNLQVRYLSCSVKLFELSRLILVSAFGVIELGPEGIVSAAGRGSKSPRNKGRAVANSGR